MVGPAVVGEVGVHPAAQHDRLEVVHPSLLPARCQAFGERRLGRAIPPDADRRRCALEDVDLLGGLGERRKRLQPTRARPDQGDGLVAELGECRARAAAGVVVVPPCRVECAPREAVHPRDHRQLHQVEDSDGEYVVAAGEFVAPVGAHGPSARAVVPGGAGDVGVEEGVGHQLEAVRDGLQVPSDLLAEGVAPGGDVVEFFEHRQVLVGLDVAHHPRVAIPVPGAADPACRIDDPDARDTGLAEMSAREQPGDAASDDHHVGIVGDGLPLDDRREGVGPVPRDELVVRQIADGRPAGNEPPVALRAVFGVHGFGIEDHGLPFQRNALMLQKL